MLQVLAKKSPSHALDSLQTLEKALDFVAHTILT